MAYPKLTFSPKQEKILFHLASMIIPSDDLQVSNWNEHLLNQATLLFREFSILNQKFFIWGLYFIELAPFLYGFGFHTFSRLSLENKRAYFEKLYHSSNYPLYAFCHQLKIFLMMSGLSHPKVNEYLEVPSKEHLLEKIKLRQDLQMKGKVSH